MKPRPFLARAAAAVAALVVAATVAVTVAAARAEDPPKGRAPAEGETVTLPPGIVARVYGEDITETQVLDRLARRYETHEKGREILEQIVDDEIVAMEARRRGVTASDDEASAYAYRQMDEVVQMKGGKKQVSDPAVWERTLTEVLAEMKTTREDFFRSAREYLVREKMAREDLGTKPEEKLPEHRMKLWLSGLRKARSVKYTGLPDGVLAAIGDDVTIDRRRFAKELSTRLPPEQVAGVRADLIVDAATRHAVAAAGIVVTDEHVAAQVARIRKRFEENPRIKGTGVTFDQFLKQTSGIGEEDLPKDPTFRSKVGLEQLLGREVSDARVREFWDANRAAYGERALVRFVFVEASDEKSRQRQTSFRDALDLAMRAKVAILEGAGLLKDNGTAAAPLPNVMTSVAKQFEPDAERKERAGEPAVWTRGGLAGEPKLEEAAFSGELGKVLGPIRTGVGYYVLYVEERRPAPTFDEVKVKIREDLIRVAEQQFRIKLRMDSNVVIGK